jgi:hypothetical protein
LGEIIAATGLDLSTVQNYAYVSRNVPYAVRSELLSWEHHRLLAKLPAAKQADWIAACVAEEQAGRRMTTRRLRKSLALGRLASGQDMEPDEADSPARRGHLPPVRHPPACQPPPSFVARHLAPFCAPFRMPRNRA